MWRPKGWKNPERDKTYLCCSTSEYAYEDGADAMLEELIKHHTWVRPIIGEAQHGILVFIPDVIKESVNA
jgi:hypothetical protein